MFKRNQYEMIFSWKRLSLGGLLFVELAIHLSVAQSATTAAEASEATTSGDATTGGAETVATTTGAPPAAETLKAGGTQTPKGAKDASGATTPQDDKKENTAGEKVDYCDPSLCSNDQRHVACNASTELDDRCSMDAELVAMTDTLRTFIVHRFNKLRDTVAMGGYNGWNPAAHMATLTWDSELSRLAEYNVQKCFLKTDDCVNTKNYKHVGQIVGFRGLRGNLPILEDILGDIRMSWVRTGSSSSMTDIINKEDSIDRPPKYNFLQMVVENAKHVGCAVLQQSRNGWFQTFFTCNFDVAPTKGAPIYESSNTAASSCQTGTNKIYKHLCSEGESYNLAARSRHKFIYFSSPLKHSSEHISSSVKAAKVMPKIQRISGIQPRDGSEATATTSGEASTGGAPANTTGETTVVDGATTAVEATTAAGSTTTTAGETSVAGAATPASEDGTRLYLLQAPFVDKSKLKKKFARFLKLINKAKLRREKRKIVVITSNHEVKENALPEAVEGLYRTLGESDSRLTARSARRHRARTSDNSLEWIVVP